MTLFEADKKARQQALDPTQSFIVQAPAGSGKTELLIQRYLTLLNHVKKPEEILAITFTKKSANEMRARVLKALTTTLSNPEPTLPHAKITWNLARAVLQKDQLYQWQLIENPNQLRIQTIDSLCSYLTKQLPLLTHFGSSPAINQNPTGLYIEAIQEVLSHLEGNDEWSEAISNLLIHLDNDIHKLEKLFFHLLQKRDQWLPYIHFDMNDITMRSNLESHLTAINTQYLNQLSTAFPKQMTNELLEIFRYAASQVTSDSFLFSLQDITHLPDGRITNKKRWQAIAQFLLTTNHTWRKKFDKNSGFLAQNDFKNPEEKTKRNAYYERLKEIIEQFSQQEELRILLENLSYLPENYYTDKQWTILKSLFTVLKILLAQLRIVFQQYGEIDFIENTQAALIALGNDDAPTDLALALDYRIQHILIDEFQDTSATQYQLLEKLIRGWDGQDNRTLFVVGDPMQSIYRFREAEVGLFIRMFQEGLPHLPLIPLKLSVNFRSTSDVVEWNNLHFKQIFPDANDVTSGAVSYSKSLAINHHENLFSNVAIHGFVNDVTTQTDNIVKVIQETLQQHPTDNIAILVRSRTHLTDLVIALKKANIPYRAVDIDPLASKQIIQDLFALTAALMNFSDTIAWLSILRAPWCGLTLHDLHLLLNDAPDKTIWQQLQKKEKLKKLSADGQTRLLKLITVLTNKLQERERVPLREWIESTWLLLGGPACLLSEDSMEDVNTYFHLLTELSQENKTFNHFLLKQKLDMLYASTDKANCQLQIMTIHSAKGLEFDTVILPRLEKKLPNDNKALLSWMEQPLLHDQMALVLAPINATGEENESIYHYISRRQKIKGEHEVNRLLYVAATRAKKRLHLFFSIQKENDLFKIENGSFLEKLWPLFEKQQQQILHEENTPILDTRQNNRAIQRLPIEWRNSYTEAALPSVPHQQIPGFHLNNHVPQLIGIVAHRLLQLLSEQRIEWWTSQSIETQRLYLQQQLLQAGILPAQIAYAINKILTLVDRTLNDQRGREILEAQYEAECEYALSATLQGQLEHIIIDKTFVDEKNIRWIIDYKTTAFTEADLDNFLQHEQQKYLEKMTLYANIIKLTDNREIRLGLYFPFLSAWKEWDHLDQTNYQDKIVH